MNLKKYNKNMTMIKIKTKGINMDTYYYSDGTISNEEDETKILHREDGPAHIWSKDDGTIIHASWYIKGERHREGGPAMVWYFPNGKIEIERWYIKGERHREDGPAVVYYYKNRRIQEKYWWISGIEYTKEKFNAYRLNQLINEELCIK